jgi:hypothetical protein
VIFGIEMSAFFRYSDFSDFGPTSFFGFIKANSGVANALERDKRMKSELQLADSLAQFFRSNKD